MRLRGDCRNGQVKTKKDATSFIGTTIVLCVFVAGTMVALVAVWLIDASIPFYIILTVVMAVAAGVNMMMVWRRLTKLKADMSKLEYWATYVLASIVLGALAAVVGICSSIQLHITTYPVIYSTMPVLMLLINGYISYVESLVTQRNAIQADENPLR